MKVYNFNHPYAQSTRVKNLPCWSTHNFPTIILWTVVVTFRQEYRFPFLNCKWAIPNGTICKNKIQLLRFIFTPIGVIYLQVFAPKLRGHCEFLPTSPSPTFTVLSNHWWMMRNLFIYNSPTKIVSSIKFISFS